MFEIEFNDEEIGYTKVETTFEELERIKALIEFHCAHSSMAECPSIDSHIYRKIEDFFNYAIDCASDNIVDEAYHEDETTVVSEEILSEETSIPLWFIQQNAQKICDMATCRIGVMDTQYNEVEGCFEVILG